MKEINQVFIYDHQFLTSQGLKFILNSRKDIEVSILGGTDQNELLQCLLKDQPDLFVVDYLAFEHGEEFIIELVESIPNTEVLGITNDTDQKRIKRLIDHGIKGLLTKNCKEEEILTAINALLNKNRFYCNSVLEALVRNDVGKKAGSEGLTSREIEVLQLIARGNSTQKIAEELSISVHTVNSHRKNMLKKLNLKSPIQLVTYALESGLINSH